MARKKASKNGPRGSRARRKSRGEKIPFVAPSCKHFTGYKPCFPQTRCLENCVNNDPIGSRILIVNLDAMGNVLATTTILQPLKRKYPESKITWITLKNAYHLLDHNPMVDEVLVWDPENWLILLQREFDHVLNVDKSQRSCAITGAVTAKEKLGFGLDGNGVIVPLNKEAMPNYLLGLDDHLKFRVNKKTVPQMLCEQFALEHRRDEYILTLSAEELAFCDGYKEEIGLPIGEVQKRDLIVGFNTGCSELYPNKKMTVDQHVALAQLLSALPRVRLVLLGGPEDTLRNAEIARRLGNMVVSTPTTEGVRRGLSYINLCDIVISGDSFGMHAAIGLKKHVIAWFGVSSAPEIDLYGRGLKLIPHGLECSPCWKRQCPYNLECIQMIDLDAIVAEVERTRSRWLSL